VRQTEADYAFTSRVHVLFQRVLRKFKGDLALWLQYVEFCQRVVSWLGWYGWTECNECPVVQMGGAWPVVVGWSVRSIACCGWMECEEHGLLWSDGV